MAPSPYTSKVKAICISFFSSRRHPDIQSLTVVDVDELCSKLGTNDSAWTKPLPDDAAEARRRKNLLEWCRKNIHGADNGQRMNWKALQGDGLSTPRSTPGNDRRFESLFASDDEDSSYAQFSAQSSPSLNDRGSRRVPQSGPIVISDDEEELCFSHDEDLSSIRPPPSIRRAAKSPTPRPSPSPSSPYTRSSRMTRSSPLTPWSDDEENDQGHPIHNGGGHMDIDPSRISPPDSRSQSTFTSVHSPQQQPHIVPVDSLKALLEEATAAFNWNQHLQALGHLIRARQLLEAPASYTPPNKAMMDLLIPMQKIVDACEKQDTGQARQMWHRAVEVVFADLMGGLEQSMKMGQSASTTSKKCDLDMGRVANESDEL